MTARGFALFPERQAAGGGVRHRRGRPSRTGTVARPLLLGAGALLAVLAGGGTALAYYSSPGSGSATATVGEPGVSASGSSVSGLRPGASGVVAVTVRNEAPRPYVVTAVRPAPVSRDASCPASALSVAAPTTLPVIPRNESATIDVTVTMLRSAPDACQGVTFDVPVDIEGSLG